MLRIAGGRPGGRRRLLVPYFLAAGLWCQASSVAGVTGGTPGPAPAGCQLRQHSQSHSVARRVPRPLDLPPQHRILAPERQQLSILGQVPAESNQDSKAEYPANQQVDDLEQHPASQPSLPPGRR